MGCYHYGGYFLLQTKDTLRQYYRYLRQRLSQEYQHTASLSARDNFFDALKMMLSHGAQKKIAVYLAHDGELSLQPLIEQLWRQQHKVFLPVIEWQTQRLQFAAYTASTSMKKNVYGIEEPDSFVRIMPQELEIVLMPLVAFDSCGNRLGMGKGYYDKSFAFQSAHSFRPLLIGVAYVCQQCDILVADSWDVPLDAILTEKSLILFGEAL